MSVKIYFWFLGFLFFLFIDRKIKLVCHSARSAHPEEKSRNVDPSSNACPGSDKPAECKTQKKRRYKRKPQLRQHGNVFHNLWPLFQYLLSFFNKVFWFIFSHSQILAHFFVNLNGFCALYSIFLFYFLLFLLLL